MVTKYQLQGSEFLPEDELLELAKTKANITFNIWANIYENPYFDVSSNHILTCLLGFSYYLFTIKTENANSPNIA